MVKKGRRHKLNESIQRDDKFFAVLDKIAEMNQHALDKMVDLVKVIVTPPFSQPVNNGESSAPNQPNNREDGNGISTLESHFIPEHEADPFMSPLRQTVSTPGEWDAQTWDQHEPGVRPTDILTDPDLVNLMGQIDSARSNGAGH